MKKYVKNVVKAMTISLASFFMATAYAEKPIHMISAWGEGGISYGMLDNLYKYDDVNFKEGIDVLGNCATVGKYLKETDDPTISLTEAFILQDESHPCNVINEDLFISLAGKAHWNFCRLESDEPVIDEFRGPIKVGYFHGADKKIPLEAILDGMGSEGTSVPYKTAPAYRAALESGEIDYIMTSMTDQYECVITTNPNEKVIEHKVSDYYDGFFSTAAYAIALVGANVDKEKVKRIFIESTDPNNSNMFTTGLARSYDSSYMDTPTGEQLEFVRSYIEKLNSIRNQ